MFRYFFITEMKYTGDRQLSAAGYAYSVILHCPDIIRIFVPGRNGFSADEAAAASVTADTAAADEKLFCDIIFLL